MTKYLISIDPGSKSAWAFWENGKLMNFGRNKDIDADKAFDFFTNFDQFDRRKTLVAIEGQWFRLPTMKNGKKVYHSANYSRVVKIIESRCWYQAAAEINGFETFIIDPGKWIPVMTRGLSGNKTDDRIKLAAKMYHPETKLIADEYAAVLLGEYVWQRLKMGVELYEF